VSWMLPRTVAVVVPCADAVVLASNSMHNAVAAHPTTNRFLPARDMGVL
jgi:hypothetical protein